MLLAYLNKCYRKCRHQAGRLLGLCRRIFSRLGPPSEALPPPYLTRPLLEQLSQPKRSSKGSSKPRGKARMAPKVRGKGPSKGNSRLPRKGKPRRD